MEKKSKKENFKKHVFKDINNLLIKNSRHINNKIIGFHNSYPHKIATYSYIHALKYNSNNLGFHNKLNENLGFTGSIYAEQQVIKKLRKIFNDSTGATGGYITPGGTEANIVTLWSARNYFKSKRIAILCSFLTHYSILKAVNLLGIEQQKGCGIHLIGTDQNGHILIPCLIQKMNNLYKNVDGIIIVANAGTTMLGSVDDIPEINNQIKKFKKDKNYFNIHFHIDAAFGGMIIPFLKNLPRIGFTNSELNSITVDMHKMGLTPFGAGIILMKNILFNSIKTKVGYINWTDSTLCGSRPGASALACHSMLKYFGIEGYTKNAIEVMKLTYYVKNELTRIGIDTFSNDINIITIKDKRQYIFNKLTKKGYKMHYQKFFPTNLAFPNKNLTDFIWNLVIMPPINKKLINKFIKDIKKL